ncbi:MAG: FAD-dependent oxidoreductase [Desulfovibrio sp.]|nr:FAD-dependent oxidoreductase [Desulfovibrio sp.]
MLTIETLSKTQNKAQGQTAPKRLSTQELLTKISKAVAEGETDFFIKAQGQHDLGGPLWNREGLTLNFTLTNPGQRVGSMALPNTAIKVLGSAPADVGWLNSGGKITVTGDAGDTAGHCAASGVIYIGGRSGTRTGSLMKKDPLYPAPELWIYKNCGSFSFEFMGGGTAVVCGMDCRGLSSILGERPCIGMVGGTIYLRGAVAELPAEVELLPLAASDKEFLEKGLGDFLKEINQEANLELLKKWQDWRKIVTKELEENDDNEQTKALAKKQLSLKEYREKYWVPCGIFSDVLPDAFEHQGLLAHGRFRLREPVWENRRFASPCEAACPLGVATGLRLNLWREGKKDEALSLMLQDLPLPISICGSICPKYCMQACSRKYLDFPIQIKDLGLLSLRALKLEKPTPTGHKIAVIGGGPVGLACAWQMRCFGHEVTIFEQNDLLGGKMRYLSESKLKREVLDLEIQRLLDHGLKAVTGQKLTAARFTELRRDFEVVVLAIGQERPKSEGLSGEDLACLGYDYLKKEQEKGPSLKSKQVVVIGQDFTALACANSALSHGAKEVTLLAQGRPKVLAEDLQACARLGAKIIWPLALKAIKKNGVLSEDGRFFEAEQIILCAGEEPILDFLPLSIQTTGLKLGKNFIDDGLAQVFAVGSCVEDGLIVEAQAKAKKVARQTNAYLKKEQLEDQDPIKEVMPLEFLQTAYYAKVREKKELSAEKESERCLSCGTCRDCHTCELTCPEQAIFRESQADGSFIYRADPTRCIGCGICSGVCPSGIWTLKENPPLVSAEDFQSMEV